MKNQHTNESEYREFNIIFRKAQDVRLTAEEKDGIWNAIRTEVSRHNRVKSDIETTVSYSNRQTSLLRRKSVYRLFMGTVMFGLVVVGGTITALAEQSLPGNLLYPVKTKITERIQMNLASSIEEKANIELAHAANRLFEAEGLAMSGKFTERARSSLEKDFGAHTSSVLTYAGKLHGNKDSLGAASVSSKLETVLLAHQDILKQIGSAQSGEISDQLQILTGSVSKSVAYASDLRASAETYSLASTSDNVRIRAAAEKANESIQGTIAAAENSMRKYGTENTGAERHLNEARSYRAQGLAKLITGAYGDALVLFGKAERTASQVSLESEIISRMNSFQKMITSRPGAAKISPIPLQIIPEVPEISSVQNSSSTNTSTEKNSNDQIPSETGITL